MSIKKNPAIFRRGFICLLIPLPGMWGTERFLDALDRYIAISAQFPPAAKQLVGRRSLLID